MTINDIKEKAIHVTAGTVINGEFGGTKEVTAAYLKKWCENFERCYGSNNGSVAFVVEGEYYILPHTQEIFEALESEGFKDRSIGVCISGSMRPADPTDYERWNHLKAEQEASNATT